MSDESTDNAKEQLDQLLADCQTKQTSVTSIVDAVKQKEGEVNTLHSRIAELKATAESDATQTGTAKTEAQTAKNSIDDLVRQSTEATDHVKNFDTEAAEKLKAITVTADSADQLREKLDNAETGVEATVAKAQQTLDQITKTGEEAAQIKEATIASKVKAEEAFKDAAQAKSKVDDELKDSVRLKGEIGSILDLVRDTGLANSFDRRRKRSQWSALIAVGVVLLGVGVSCALVYGVFVSSSGQKMFEGVTSDYVKFLLRLTLTAPGVFLAWFGAAQYAKERYFLEQYEFKTAAALALENYSGLLKKNYSDRSKDIFNLSVELIRMVYKEPEYRRSKSEVKVKVAGTEASATADE